ncbi:MAG TPA: outer membrane beta-barrel protein [Pseudolabrys sp.]|jgi:opacity protein-like surface antigen|nr:outer membrane beta-barrel protein [Pseudolabrys sp.]
MSWLRLCAVAGLVVSNAAVAADMPGTLPPPAAIAPLPVLSASPNWYLRGDLGYYWGTMSGAQAAPGFASPSGNDPGNGFVGGVGAGFKSGWVRADVTVDYTSDMKYSGTVATAGDVTAKIDAVTALFNGYLDLGTWYGITPYIGAGAGMANLHAHDYATTATAPAGSGLSNSQWKFAWAVMGGAGYSIAPNLTLDASYRYVNFGDVTAASDASGAMTLKNLAAHEVRVGVRWSFDDLVR